MSGEPSTISFLESFVPTFEAGEYEVKVEQQLKNLKPTGPPDTIDETWQGSRRIVVSGERFTLAPGSIQSCFPPANSRGEYSDALPHLVLSNLTLPWQREAGGGGRQPWLALLVFEAADPIPQPLKVKVGDLQRKDFVREPGHPEAASDLPRTTASYGDAYAARKLEFAPEYGESFADPCVAIDVPAARFAEVAPSLGDLPWLAHARTVPVGAKAGEPAGTYSTIIAGRPIHGSEPCTAHLVSLEGMQPFLPANGTYAPASITTSEGIAADTVRLLSLYSWNFTSVEPKESFREYLTGLSCTALQRPLTKKPGSAAESVDKAFGLGYTAVDHATRDGSSTVSWYRGPLVPLAQPSPTIASPVESADQLLRYEPATGMFDATYAAAWQLGRLLGLQSRSFSVALYDWRRGVARAAALAGDEAGRLAVRSEAEAPEAVTSWLTKLRLLNGVPFNYLVADEGLLEQESIRFFQLDPNWCEALVEGALSIGRSTSADRDHDAVLVPTLRETARRLAPSVREPGAEAEDATTPISGFLLRSAVVPGWPGVEIEAYAAGGTEPLKAIRMDHLASNMLLMMVEGPIDHVKFHEPAEALHFGLEPGGGKTELRYVTVPASAPAGTEPGSTLAAPAVKPSLRQGGALKVEELAGQMEAQLNDAHANDDPSTGKPRAFASAEFALQMIEAADAVTFVNRPPSPA
jgi:hypothetical protein